MSSCSRQYASRHISGLKKSYETSLFVNACSTHRRRQQPLLFLYPSWFQQCWHHQYHTDREPGLDRRTVSRKGNRKPSQKAEEIAGHRTSHPKQGIDPLKPSLIKDRHPSNPKDNHYRRTIDTDKVFAAYSKLLNEIEQSVVKEKTTFIISKDHARNLLGHDEPDAWIHHEDTGCVVIVSPNPNETTNTVTLDGSDRARELARDYINSFLTTEQYVTASQDSIVAWLSSVKRFPASSDISTLPKPPQWTVKTIRRYVLALTRTRHRHGMKRWHHKYQQHHNLRIAGLLRSIFTQPETAPFASSNSLELALRFCRQNTELGPECGEIWDAAVSLGLPLGIAIYNEELGRCLVNKNGSKLIQVIDMMRRRQTSPNKATWSILLQYAESSQSRFHMLHRCLQAGVLDLSEPSPGLVEALVRGELIHYLSHSNGMLQFVKDMDNVFGSDWLTTRVLVRMLRVCRIGRARVDSASTLLAEVARRQSPSQIMNRACLLELIKLAKKAVSLRDALEVLTSNVVQDELDLHSMVLQPLFELAWRSRSLNVCRLLWIFACTWGKTTFPMKDILWHSLQGNTNQSFDKRTQNWQRLAGKLVVSRTLVGESMKKALPHLFHNGPEASPLLRLLRWTHGPARHEQLQLAHLLIERDLNAWRFHRPLPLDKMRSLLMEALEMDSRLEAADTWGILSDDLTIDGLSSKMQRLPLSLRANTIKHQYGDRFKDRRVFVLNGISLDYDTLELAPDTTTRRRVEEAQDSGMPADASQVSSLSARTLADDESVLREHGQLPPLSDIESEGIGRGEDSVITRDIGSAGHDKARSTTEGHVDQPRASDAQGNASCICEDSKNKVAVSH